MSDLKNLVDTIVILMMENRSFDNILGHLSMPSYGNRKDVDGLRTPLKDPKYANPAGRIYYPRAMSDDKELKFDLPHNRPDIETIQLAKLRQKYTMSGFVKSYFEKWPNHRPRYPDPMGYFKPTEVPITNFLANNYAVCDRWFSPIPTSTVPNRLMSLSGRTSYEDTKPQIHNAGHILIDWLDNRHIPWRVYHDGFFSFFTLLARKEIFGSKFRSISDLKTDMQKPSEDKPKVLIVEPSYYDAPIFRGEPNDNHAPLPVGPGELFIKRIYDIATSNKERWKKTVMILTYDEHGGFYDHVQPLRIEYNPTQGNFIPFKSTGPRVPSIVISPLVSAGRVYSGNMDHTSILQFIAERFDPQSNYSPAVKSRRDHKIGIKSVSDVLDLDENTRRDDIPKLPKFTLKKTKRMVGRATSQRITQEDEKKGLMEKAFIKAGKNAVKSQRSKIRKKFPELITWYDDIS